MIISFVPQVTSRRGSAGSATWPTRSSCTEQHAAAGHAKSGATKEMTCRQTRQDCTISLVLQVTAVPKWSAVFITGVPYSVPCLTTCRSAATGSAATGSYKLYTPRMKRPRVPRRPDCSNWPSYFTPRARPQTSSGQNEPPSGGSRMPAESAAKASGCSTSRIKAVMASRARSWRDQRDGIQVD